MEKIMWRSPKSIYLAGMLSLSGSALALDFDFNGTFKNDNDIVLLDFTVDTASTITIFSSSWLQGNSGLGFDPILAIWDSAGNLVNQQDDGWLTGSAMSNGVNYDYGVWDSYFDVFLNAGDYTASIGQYNNFANGTNLADGFIYDGNPNFTFDLGYGMESLFNGVWSSTDARTGDWEFHILNAAEASQQVPEPTTLALMGIGLAGIAYQRRKKTIILTTA